MSGIAVAILRTNYQFSAPSTQRFVVNNVALAPDAVPGGVSQKLIYTGSAMNESQSQWESVAETVRFKVSLEIPSGRCTIENIAVLPR
jgi:hypothetical protein